MKQHKLLLTSQELQDLRWSTQELIRRLDERAIIYKTKMEHISTLTPIHRNLDYEIETLQRELNDLAEQRFSIVRLESKLSGEFQK